MIARVLVLLVLAIMMSPVTLDAAKGGGGKGGTCDWQTYYECIADGGDRLYCLSRCLR